MFGNPSLGWAVAHLLVFFVGVGVGPTYNAQRPQDTLPCRAIILSISIGNLVIALQEALRYFHWDSTALWLAVGLFGVASMYPGLTGAYLLWRGDRGRSDRARSTDDLEAMH